MKHYVYSLGVLIFSMPTFLFAQESSDLCITVAGQEGDVDLVTLVNLRDLDPRSNETSSLQKTGTKFIEAIAIEPGSGILFAADADTLGTIDFKTGKFQASSNLFGAGNGTLGIVKFKDVDGLSFDLETNILYGTARRTDQNESDVLIQIDTLSGKHITNAFGHNRDYLEITPVDGLSPKVEDIAIDPQTGEMFAVVENTHPVRRSSNLIRIDKLTGETTLVGSMGVSDIRGLAFSPNGQLLATKAEDNFAVFFLDKLTGLASADAISIDNGSNYEALDCLFIDSDKDGLNDIQERNASNPTSPFVADGDRDGLLDGEEDANRNGIRDETETDPNKKDTDGGGANDLEEIQNFLDPLDADDDARFFDSDGDGLSDENEADFGTDPFRVDSDGDLLLDSTEVLGRNPTSPLRADTDRDGLLDGEEDANQNGSFDFGETDPNNRDTDNDGIVDSQDRENGPVIIFTAEGGTEFDDLGAAGCSVGNSSNRSIPLIIFFVALLLSLTVRNRLLDR